MVVLVSFIRQQMSKIQLDLRIKKFRLKNLVPGWMSVADAFQVLV